MKIQFFRDTTKYNLNFAIHNYGRKGFDVYLAILKINFSLFVRFS